jgi:hypothetical protein
MNQFTERPPRACQRTDGMNQNPLQSLQLQDYEFEFLLLRCRNVLLDHRHDLPASVSLLGPTSIVVRLLPMVFGYASTIE